MENNCFSLPTGVVKHINYKARIILDYMTVFIVKPEELIFIKFY